MLNISCYFTCVPTILTKDTDQTAKIIIIFFLLYITF